MRLPARPLHGILVGMLLWAACGPRPEERASAPAKERGAQAEPGPVETEMRRVDLRVLEEVRLHIDSLRGRLVPRKPGTLVVFDDPNSFLLEIDSAEIAIATPDLARLMNQWVFAYEGSPLKRLDFAIVGSQLRLEGQIEKGVDVPFSMLGEVSIAPDGWIRVHPTKVEAVGIPVDGLLDFFGLELEKLVKLKGNAAARIEGDDFYLDPERLLPPPQIKGRVTAVRLEGDRLVQVFGPGKIRDPLAPPKPDANYLFFRGGVLRFGKLTMSDADLQIVDADPKDPFDFYQAKYQGQLVAGYSQNTQDGGLIVHMPDWGSGLHLPLRGPTSPSPGQGRTPRRRD